MASGPSCASMRRRWRRDPGRIGDITWQGPDAAPAPASAHSASSSGSRRAVATTVKPRRANSSAVARPMPELAPVIQATPSAGLAR